MIFFVLIILLGLPMPDTLSLDQAHELATARFPLEDRVAMEQDIRSLRVSNANARWLPELTLGALAQYQSDATSVSIDLPGLPGDPGFPSQPKDRYQIFLELDQPLYDGGRIKTRKELENRSADRALWQIRVEQYELKQRVNTVWFAIHGLQAQQKALELTSADIRERISEMEVRVRHGAAPSSSLDILRAESLRLEQHRGMLAARERATMSVLSDLLDADLSPGAVLLLPDPPDMLPTSPQTGERPETALFQSWREELAVRQTMVAASYRPTVSAFGQAAAGRPGLDLFDDDFQPWYIVGVRARWNIWNRGMASRERQELQVRSRLVDNQEEVFHRNIRMAVYEDIETMSELTEAIRRDEEIIALHESIIRDAASRLENGVITPTEYLSELNSRQRAVVNRDLHRIELARTWQNYLTLTGAQR
jgi:outer membrane protein TolC